MEINEGKLDKIIRIVLGLIFVACLFFIDGGLKILLGVVGVVLVVTGAIGFCGIYKLLGINTKGKKEK